MSTFTSHPVAVRSRPMTLRVTDPTFRASSVPLAGARLVIGRAEDAEVLLDSQTVSRHHAELVRDPFGRWWVRDLGSRNGTRVNGAKVAEAVLQPGDVLEIGGFTLSLGTPAGAVPETDTRSASIAPVGDSVAARISRLREYDPPRIEAAQLSALTGFGHELNVTQDADERLRRLCRLMTGTEFRGHCALVLRVDRADPSRPVVLGGPVNSDTWQGDAPPLSRGVLKNVCDVPEPVLATNVSPATDQVELSISAEVMAMTVIAAPVRFDERVVDVLYTVLAPEYGHSDWLALAALAAKQFQQAEAVWQNFAKIREYATLARELEVAQQIQRRLIPAGDVRPDGVEVAIGFRPCRWVGGDYADVVPLADGRVLLVVADVCGKGLPAALITSSLHTMVHAHVGAGNPVGVLADALNAYLGRYLSDELFVTMICVALDPRTGAYECVNAGHPPGMIVGPDGAVRQMEAGVNAPLGIGADLVVDPGGTLAAGELLALYTDGLTEACDGRDEMLGTDGLAGVVRGIYAGAPDAPVAALADRLTEALDRYEQGRMASDDRTFLLVRLRG